METTKYLYHDPQTIANHDRIGLTSSSSKYYYYL